MRDALQKKEIFEMQTPYIRIDAVSYYSTVDEESYLNMFLGCLRALKELDRRGIAQYVLGIDIGFTVGFNGEFYPVCSVLLLGGEGSCNVSFASTCTEGTTLTSDQIMDVFMEHIPGQIQKFVERKAEEAAREMKFVQADLDKFPR